MKKLTKILSAVAISSLIATTAIASDEHGKKVEHDAESGLIIAPGMEEVKTNCTVCHSAKFILLQKGDRDTWLQMIRWMQATQGLWNFDEATENTILTYLATNYPPEAGGRRKALPANLMPSNPYDKK